MQNDHSREIRILAGVDLSRTGDDALTEAMRLVRLSDSAALHVVHVIQVDRSLHDAERVDELSRTLDEKRNALEERLAGHTPDGGEPWAQDVVLHVRLGDPAEAIHQCAVDIDADFIVVGTQGRTGVDRLMHASVAEKLVRSAHISVIVAHRKDVADLRRSDQPDPPRPGDDLTSTGISASLHLEFLPRTSHISGLV